MFHQFSQYLQERDKYGNSVQKRDTTVESKSGQIQGHMQDFLRDVYPGLTGMPNKLVELLVSPDPDTTLNLRTNLNPEDETCNESRPSTDKRTVPKDDARGNEEEIGFKVATVSSEKCCKQLCNEEQVCVDYNFKQFEVDNRPFTKGNQCTLKYKLSDKESWSETWKAEG